MRIALITPGFSADETDWCIPALLNLVRALACDHEVHVFTLRYPQRRRSYQVYGATVHALGGGRKAGVLRVSLLGRALARILSVGRRQPFDVVHGLWADEPGFLAIAAGHLLRTPALVSLMGGELVSYPDIKYGGQRSRVNRLLTRTSLHRAASVTVGSTSLFRLAEHHVLDGRLTLLPLGVDTKLFNPSPGAEDPQLLGEGEWKLLHVASLVPVKDQAMLLRALALAVERKPQIQLHIVGEGPLRGELEHQAAALGVAAQVTLHGAVSHERLPAYYRAADFCVLASRYESQGMVALEAAACGRPTIGTAVGLLPDLQPATRCVPVGDARKLAAVMLETLESPRMLRSMGRLSRELVEAKYSLESMIGRLTSGYDSVASHSLDS